MTPGEQGPRIEPGARVTLHYTLALAGGRVVETSRGAEAVTLVVGRGDWLPVLENLLLGLRAGELRRFEVAAADVSGGEEVSEPQILAREEFPPEMRLAPGMVIGFALPAGEEVPGTILEVSEREVTVDFSHPLLGRDLLFEVEILEVIPPDRA